ncbi:hypothetical protein CDL12_06427 [Handroanthus impetiginosus]|uniref:Uncharacterized protein n=1 Tax=Handroanthus impetiginosus TaxID=429701 RepID=A0A2G9HTN1_9LAMI|nr:hypothetical protein CDL12_06427 [Handroanthus impetiginosus]
MDLKLKGKSWAGNIYHRFESICQDVDGFMSKDTVKFVENQVQIVGTSVKRFYSNVVQDVIPLSGDKLEEQSADGEQAENQDHVNSITGIRTQPTCVNEKLLSLAHGSTDAVSYADPREQAETDLHLRGDGDAIIWNDTDNGLKENITRDTMPVTSNSSFQGQIFPRMSNEDHKNSTLTMASSPAFSAHEEGLLPINDEKMEYNHQKGKTGFPGNAQCLSLSSSSELLESKPPMVEDPENRSSSASPLGSSDKVDEDNSPLKDSPLHSTCDAAQRAMRKDGTLCDCFSTNNKSFDVSSSVQSLELMYSCILHNEEEMGVMSSTCPTPPKPCGLSMSTSANFTEKAENITSRAESNNMSTLSSTIESYDTKAGDMLPPFLIMESNDNNAFLNDGSDFMVGPLESRLEQHHKDFQSETAISPSKTGNTYEFEGDGDLNMETIDLNADDLVLRSSQQNLQLRQVRQRVSSSNFRYYKKLIQDAFTSRKRLSKEYEHLAILYGDIDMESSQNFEPCSVPFSSNSSIHAVRILSSQETCETEWELL